jgi:hypothetical protein
MNGFFTPDLDLVPLQARSEVFSASVQDILAGLHHGRMICCACRFPELAGLPLEVIKQPDGRFRLDRRSVADRHAVDCVFRLNEDFEARPPPPDLVFDLTGRREASAPAFRHVGRHILSASHSTLFARSLADPERNPSVAEFLAEYGRRLRSAQAYPFYALQEAATVRGLGLSVGFLHLPLDFVPEDLTVPLVFETWSDAIGGMTAKFMPVDGQAWTDALASLMIIGRRCIGPYLFLAATNAAGKIVKLGLYPVYIDAEQVIPVDSHTERKRVAQLVKVGVRPYKPVRMDHFREVVKRVGKRFGVAISSPQFRADFAYLGGDMLIIEEVCGFAPGPLPAYDSHFERKRQAVSLKTSPGVRYSFSNGWLLPEIGAISCPYCDGGLAIEVSLSEAVNETAGTQTHFPRIR